MFLNLQGSTDALLRRANVEAEAVRSCYPSVSPPSTVVAAVRPEELLSSGRDDQGGADERRALLESRR
jgi:hypothetical protein